MRRRTLTAAALALAGCGTAVPSSPVPKATVTATQQTATKTPAVVQPTSKPKPKAAHPTHPTAAKPNPNKRLTDGSTCNDWMFASPAAEAAYVAQTAPAPPTVVKDSIDTYCTNEVLGGTAMHDRIANGLP